METTATITSKGQVTIPKAVREALGLEVGDVLVFRVDDHRAIVAKSPDFLDLAGSISVPAHRRGAAWQDVLRATRSARARSGR